MTNPPPEQSRWALHLSAQDRRGLVWLRNRTRSWMFDFKRDRKYACQARSGFTPEEIVLLGAITDNRDRIDVLLGKD